ncbi:methyl-accepting chemotaxis protein [Roseibium algae]|uniref:Methyl-accepting chemotaxis protein n=1 Tax=Roseibium algae TaxID=3123038 RepID=A0ABU8TLF8_9HYPH
MMKRFASNAAPKDLQLLDPMFDFLDRISDLSARTATFEDWLSGYMAEVCNYTDWKIGHAWAPCPDTPDELKSLEIWHILPGIKADSFKAKTESLRFKSGVGLPGRVHQKARLDWIQDVNLDDNYPRKPFAKEAGLMGGYGCPVIVQGKVAAVIEFYDNKPANPDPSLVRLLEYLGSQVAPVLERSERAHQRNELATDLETKVSNSVKAISQAALSMKEAAETASNLSSQAQTKSDTSAQASTQSSNQIQLVTTASADLLQAIRSIEVELGGTRATVSTASDRILAANSTFESLKEGAKEIEDVVNIINKIADKTKLLSLNATIEASRAGERGAGFAVVASEVKELAAQTEKSTNHIAQRVREIQNFTSEAIGEFQAITDIISKIDELTNTISDAMGEQQRTGNLISENASTAENQSMSACQAVQDVTEQLVTIDSSSRYVFQTATEFVERMQDLQVEVGGFVDEIRKG